jgi:hypothetical protein
MNEALQQLIDFVKSASPTVWGVLVKQVYVYAVADILWALMLIAVAFLLYRLAMANKPQYDRDEKNGKFDKHWELGIPLCFCGSAVFTLVAFGLLVMAVMALINPYYYAITNVLSSIGGK